jgi:hypothetical protein
MDALDRMHQHLVATITAHHPQYLQRPFEVSELHQTILPYRHHRRALGLDTNDEYEQVLTELLSGARGYLIVDDRMRDTLLRELASPNTDPGAFRQFGSALVALSPRGARGGDLPAGATSASGAALSPERATDMASAPRAPAQPERAQPAEPAQPVPHGQPHPPSPAAASGSSAGGGSCRFCEATLPAGREITFCPFCGQNLRVVGCDGCGAELEPGWHYCTACGRHTGR